MRRHLFLTGPIGCGKSTYVLAALGENIFRAGGFLTLRRRTESGKPADFVLMTPDGQEKAVFLDLTGDTPQLHMDVFSGLGAKILRRAGHSPFLLLDEIGGIELLCPEFMEALDRVLDSPIPILGVIKGEGPAGALVQALGLSREYEEAARCLRARLQADPDTCVYPCGQFDKTALALTKRWVKEYLHE